MSRIEKSLIQEYAQSAATAVAETAVAGLAQCTVTLSGDDSRLRNTWEEICAQVQGEKSFFWDTYQQFMRDLVLAELAKMPSRDLAAIWLQTDAGWDWHSDFEYQDQKDGIPSYRTHDTPAVPYVLDDIATFIEERLLSMAESYSNKNIRGYLERDYEDGYDDEDEDDDEDDEDDEELRERLIALMPRDSVVTDLWDWDIRFEELSFDDLAEAAFADEDALAAYARGLANDFLRWIDEYGMDYSQQDWFPREFAVQIKQECLDFMTCWRANVRKEFLR